MLLVGHDRSRTARRRQKIIADRLICAPVTQPTVASMPKFGIGGLSAAAAGQSEAIAIAAEHAASIVRVLSRFKKSSMQIPS